MNKQSKVFSPRLSSSTILFRALMLFCISSMLISCSKGELAQPNETTIKEESSIDILEGQWDTSDDCSFWSDPTNYTTEIVGVEYNIIELTNAFNLMSNDEESATMHISIADELLMVPPQSYMDGRYEVSGSGSIDEEGSITISIEILESQSGDTIQSCTLNLSR